MPDFTNDAAAIFTAERLLPATPDQVFAAFQQPNLLAKWWGPDGFTNTFQTFEFVPGGHWTFVMHAPDGADYHNEHIFLDIVPGRRIVTEHLGEPHFLLTITLTARGEGTLVTWQQEFESPEVAESVRAICIPSNQQVLDRLQAVIRDTVRATG